MPATTLALSQAQMAGAFKAVMYFDETSGLYVPVSSTNPLPTSATFSGTLAEGVADGGDVAQGAIADAVVVAGAAGTLSAKLRAISRDVGTTAALSKNAGNVDATTLRVITAADGPLNTSISALLARTGHSSRISVTRPNDTNSITAGDVVGASTASAGAVWEFTNIGIANGTILVKNLYFEIDVTSLPSGMSSFRLHLYNVTPPSALGDNAAWTLAAGDRTAYLGYIDIPLPTLITSTTVFVSVDNIDKMFPMGATTSLFAYLVSNGTYTPTAQAVKVIRMNSIDL